MGFTTGASVSCLDASVEDSVTVSLDGRSFAMPRDETATIWLRPVI
ncbi:MAG: ferrous iron transport protein A [Synergistaceae bacterium]|nr:ferrous iron transport protein A [Synergistaceae bacterium]